MSENLYDKIEISDNYSKYRPSPPENVILTIVDYLKEKISSDRWDIAVDVGCGNGQGTNLLAKHFNKVYGYDISYSQIEMAKRLQHSTNVYYEVSSAESFPLENNSVQLITAFAAAHWFDLDKFFTEANRVLVPNGVVAFSCYTFPEKSNKSGDDSVDEEIVSLFNDFYDNKLLLPYKNKRMDDLVKNRYKDLKIPDNYNTTRVNITVPKKYNGHNFFGFMKAFAPYQMFIKEHSVEGQQFTNEIEMKLRKILNNDLSCEKITFNFEHFIVMSYKIE